MTRLMLMTFFGKRRWQRGVHPHESPPVMTVPLIILGIGSVVGGLLLNNWIVGWLDPAVGGEGHGEATGLLHFSPIGGLTLAVVAIGVAISRADLRPAARHPDGAARHPLAAGPRRPQRPLRRRDQRGGVHAPGQRLTDGLVRLEDNGIDGTVNGTATAIGGLSAGCAGSRTGSSAPTR